MRGAVQWTDPKEVGNELEQVDAEVSDVGSSGDFLVEGEDSLVVSEAEGDMGDGAATIEGEVLGTSPSEPPVTTEAEQPEQISRENTTDRSSDQTGEVPASRHELVEATMSDPTLKDQRELADKEANWFKWCEGLLFKYQLDVLGNSTKKLCLPKPFRE